MGLPKELVHAADFYEGHFGYWVDDIFMSLIFVIKIMIIQLYFINWFKLNFRLELKKRITDHKIRINAILLNIPR